MRAQMEAVAEFLVRHGGLDEYDVILQTMRAMGWELSDDSPARWRSLIAIMRAELTETDQPIHYVFLFERMLQLYIRIPIDLCRKLFDSKLIFHIIVERLAAAYESYDAEVFKLESDVLCHAENIYGICMLIQDKLYSGDSSSALATFLREFSSIFDQDEPKDAWETFRATHRVPLAVFRRDMKRMLWWIEDEVFGKTVLERTVPSEDSTPAKRVVIPRHLLEAKFNGSSNEWRHLADAITIPAVSEIHSAERRASKDGDGMTDLVSETPPGDDYEDRVWSARLPIATPGANSDSSSDSESNRAMDEVVRQEKPTIHSPARNRARSRSPLRRDTRVRQPRAPEARVSQQENIAPRATQDEQVDSDVAEELRVDEDDSHKLKINRKRKGRKFWSEAEVDALIKGVKRFGKEPSVWKLIKQAHPVVLESRTNVDIKDKYRNLVRAKRIPPIARI